MKDSFEKYIQDQKEQLDIHEPAAYNLDKIEEGLKKEKKKHALKF